MLIDYLEDTATFIRTKRERLQKLEKTYNVVYDRDLKREMQQIREEIRRKSGEITTQLLFNLDEFRAIAKYFPELMQALADDPDIGSVIVKKAWLLDYASLPEKEAVARFREVVSLRSELKDAIYTARKWVGYIEPRSFVATYPLLRGYIQERMHKDEVVEILKKVDKMLIREGWLILLSPSLISIPINKFISIITPLHREEIKAISDLKKVTGKGTMGETTAAKKLQEIHHKKKHYETILTQILLANPDYLRSLKKKKWLDKKSDYLQKFVSTVTPHSIRERVWLNEMQKKLRE